MLMHYPESHKASLNWVPLIEQQKINRLRLSFFRCVLNSSFSLDFSNKSLMSSKDSLLSLKKWFTRWLVQASKKLVPWGKDTTTLLNSSKFSLLMRLLLQRLWISYGTSGKSESLVSLKWSSSTSYFLCRSPYRNALAGTSPKLLRMRHRMVLLLLGIRSYSCRLYHSNMKIYVGLALAMHLEQAFFPLLSLLQAVLLLQPL